MRFKLEESAELQGWWVLIDTINLVVVKFQEGKFNDTQEVTLLNGNEVTSMEDAMKKIRVLREMADWLRENHYNIAMG